MIRNVAGSGSAAFRCAGMSWERIMKQLEEFERQVLIGQDHIARQRKLITDVERSELPASHERGRLATFY